MSDDEDDLPMPIVSEAERCTAVDGLPGVVTGPSLRRFHLGVVSSHGLLCCITCPRLKLLNLNTANEHIKSHVPVKHRLSKRKLIALCQKFEVYEGMVSFT